jgi:hypothetical protein
MNNRRFLVHRSALLAFNVLTQSERCALEAAVAPLRDLPEKRWSKAGATPLESAEPLYFVRVDDSLRAIVRPTEGDQPEVVEIVRHETLERFFQKTG